MQRGDSGINTICDTVAGPLCCKLCVCTCGQSADLLQCLILQQLRLVLHLAAQRRIPAPIQPNLNAVIAQTGSCVRASRAWEMPVHPCNDPNCSQRYMDEPDSRCDVDVHALHGVNQLVVAPIRVHLPEQELLGWQQPKKTLVMCWQVSAAASECSQTFSCGMLGHDKGEL